MPNPLPALPHTPWVRSLLFSLGGSMLVGFVVLAFVWPTATASARDLPVAIAGPAQQTQAIKEAIDATSPGLIDFRAVADRASAIRSIEERETYGAILLGAAPEVLVASASSTTTTTLLRTVASRIDAASGAAPVTDVVPLAAGDPNGAGLIAASFPLVLGGMLGGILISTLVVGFGRRLTALLIYSAGAGLLVVGITQLLFGILQGPFLINVVAIGFSMLATASLIVGLNALWGTIGLAIGAAVTMFIGNPISGAGVPYQFIAGPWGEVGRYFVPGAASTLIRGLSYFPNADSTMAWLVLAGWTVLGLALSALGHRANRSPRPVSPSELDPVAA
jgi:hypothetical protein